MELLRYLETVYGYNAPIFLKDVRLYGKSKESIKEAIYRLHKLGLIKRFAVGIYYLEKEEGPKKGLTIEDVLSARYLFPFKEDSPSRERSLEGYYSGKSFLYEIGLLQNKPLAYEITTNRTQSKLREASLGNDKIILRKGRVKIDENNHKTLQFLDMFQFLSLEEGLANQVRISAYIEREGLKKADFQAYINVYGEKTLEKLIKGCFLSAFL